MEGFYSLTGIHALQYSFSLSFTYLKQIRQQQQKNKKKHILTQIPPHPKEDKRPRQCVQFTKLQTLLIT